MTAAPPACPWAVARESVAAVEDGVRFAPRFDAAGLIPVVTTEAGSGLVLMMAHMNAEALERTLTTGEAHYWSRSRGCLWRKGEISGLVQRVVEVRGTNQERRSGAGVGRRRTG